MNRTALWATLLYALAVPLGAQTVKQQTDSIRRETCRGGQLSSNGLTCSGATASPRVTVIRRLANRIDSLLAPLPPPPPASQPPTASFTVVCASGTCTFDGRGSTGKIASYGWRSTDPERPPKTGAVVTRIYSSTAQPWTEWLTVTDSAGLADSTSHPVSWATAPPPPPPPDTTTPSPPPAGSPAELPRVLLSFPYPAPLRSVSVPAGANLQAALDAALPGDELVLAAGATYTGNFTLSTCGASWLLIRSGGTIPSGRMTPTAAQPLAKIVTPNTAPALKSNTTSCKLWLSGLEVSISPTVTASNYGLIILQGPDQVLDRVYGHGQLNSDLIRVVSIQGARQQVSSSWLSECHANGSDSQAVWGGTGPGPYRIVDNYLECAGENIMFGGVDPSTPGLVPSDIEIRRNHLRKPLTWQGSSWTVKNSLEFKNAARVLVEGNVLDGSWLDNGGTVIVKSANQSGGCPWCRSTDITIRRNLITNAGNGIAVAATGDNPNSDTTARRVLIEENVIDLNQPGNRTGAIILARSQSVSWVRNVVSGSTKAAAIVEGGAPCTFDSNVWTAGSYGVFSSGVGSGTAALNKGCGLSGWSWTAMTLIGNPASGYPSGTTWVSSEAAAPLAAQIRGIVSTATAGVVVPP